MGEKKDRFSAAEIVKKYKLSAAITVHLSLMGQVETNSKGTVWIGTKKPNLTMVDSLLNSFNTETLYKMITKEIKMTKFQKLNLKWLRRLYYILVPTYRILELRYVTYREADVLIKNTRNLREELRWVIALEENTNSFPLGIWLCRKVRIRE